ncbi:MAG: DUF308 domain-containing protein [Lachnospiraceae bacterium]|nr:DUF308 domain-containing protein [Lachnospiraceae bacterium]
MKRNTRTSVVQNIILILVGVVLVIYPQHSLTFLVTMIGWGLIIGGISGMFTLISALVPSVMVYCILMLLFGILFIRTPQTFASIIPFLVGIGVIANGCTKVYYAWLGKDAVGYNPVRDILFAVIMIIFGILIVAHPFGAGSVAVILIGIIMIYNGIVNLVTPEKDTFL